jgi:ParB family chromosome partitioning protein
MNKQTEQVIPIPLCRLSPFPNHPFLVLDDDAMQRLEDSIQQVGLLTPVIVRSVDGTNYQLISGHRRKRACERLGMTEIPGIILEVDENEAIVMMVDSNFQRERILPSEKARAYKMKLDAVKRQGARNDLTSAPPGPKSRRKTARERIAENSPDSSTMIQRYVRLNELIPELLDLVDQGKIAITPAVEISYLTTEEQTMLLSTIASEQNTPSLSQAQRMRKLSKAKKLTEDTILSILSEPKKPECWNLTLPINKISRYFPTTYTPRQMQETIILLLEQWLTMKMKQQNEKGGRNHV